MIPVNKHRLWQLFDPASVGSLRAEAPTVDVDMVEKAVLAAYAARGPLDEAPLEERTLALAHELVDQHRVGD